MNVAKSTDHIMLSKCLTYSNTERIEIVVGSPLVLHAVELTEECVDYALAVGIFALIV